MPETPTLKFEVRQKKDGADLMMMGCIDNKCTQLDKVEFDRANRVVAPKIRDWLNEMFEGDVRVYKEQTCERLLGKTLRGDQCTKRPTPTKRSRSSRSRKSAK